MKSKLTVLLRHALDGVSGPSGKEDGDFQQALARYLGAEAGLETFAYEAGSCPEAEKASRQAVNLLTHLRVTSATAR